MDKKFKNLHLDCSGSVAEIGLEKTIVSCVENCNCEDWVLHWYIVKKLSSKGCQNSAYAIYASISVDLSMMRN